MKELGPKTHDGNGLSGPNSIVVVSMVSLEVLSAYP